MSVPESPGAPTSDVTADTARAELRQVVDHAAHYLPAQAPIARFVHHNTLHAFEDEPFEKAVLHAHELLGAEPYLDEASYEAAVRAGRILEHDLVEAVSQTTADVEILPGLTRHALRLRRLLVGVPDVHGDTVEFLVTESGLLDRLPPAVTEESKARLLAHGDESRVLLDLWRRALVLAAGTRCRSEVTPARRVRTAESIVVPHLLRFTAAYLDQGVAYWPMPGRGRGMWPAFVEAHTQTAMVLPSWLHGVPDELRAAPESAEDVILAELQRRGTTSSEWFDVVHRWLQMLPGWAGMVRQLEARPDLAPGEAPPARLMDYLATLVVLERHALASLVGAPGNEPAARSRDDGTSRVALEIFHAALNAGLGAPDLDSLRGARLAEEVARFDSLERRRAYHRAYERRFRVRVLDALAARAHDRVADPERPLVHAVFCIDERAESFRRHLEEVEPRVSTLGYPGNFDVMHAYQGFGEAKPVPLCPPVVTARHLVREVSIEGSDRPLIARRRTLRAVQRATHVGSRTMTRGGFASLLGVAHAVPLVMKTLLPRLTYQWTRSLESMIAPFPKTRLALTRRGDEPLIDGLFPGYTIEEQAGVVANALRLMGLTHGFAELVMIVGHGATTTNNPHASAYNCGACAGGRGGPNARAFAQMANHPDVRRLVAERGIVIPQSTWFAGACHDTATDHVAWLDEDLIPEHLEASVRELKAALAEAGARDAQERCRRFVDAPLDMPPRAALAHAEARAFDLAQPRPEYCHATNAVCVVGRRSLTRGLFLDRRAFLVSYDPESDDADGTVLEPILTAVGPVGAGINLEYYFSRVDQERYGCGTKLPHNVSGLIGVMNGHASDLRTGLHWQTVEIHEPMRLLVVVEAPAERVLAIVARNATIRRLAVNRWILVAVVDPRTQDVAFFEQDGFVTHQVGPCEARAPSSIAVSRGRRDHLPFALLDAPPAPGGAR